MFGRKLVFTARSTIVAGALVALCLPMSNVPAQASTPSASKVQATAISSHVDDLAVFSGDAYVNEMGITNAPRNDLGSFSVDMGGSEAAHARPSADGIIAILIGL